MSTNDVMNLAQRRMAEHAFDLKRKYKETHGMTKPQFLRLYDMGEIQLSSVFENLLVKARNVYNKKTERVSADGYDFVKIVNRKRVPLGDMKTCTLGKIRNWRRYFIRNCGGKQGYVYAVCYNWITDDFNYFAIPPLANRPAMLAIAVDRETGAVTSSTYAPYECASFEEMINKG